MKAPDLYALSDGIKALKALFDMHSTVTLNEEGVGVVTAELERLRQLALTLEHEKSCALWNAEARRDWMNEAYLTNIVCDEVERPGSNVKLFPVIRALLSMEVTQRERRDGQNHLWADCRQRCRIFRDDGAGAALGAPPQTDDAAAPLLFLAGAAADGQEPAGDRPAPGTIPPFITDCGKSSE